MKKTTRKPSRLRCFVAMMDLSGKTTMRTATSGRYVHRKPSRSDWNAVGDDLRVAMSKKKSALTVGR